MAASTLADLAAEMFTPDMTQKTMKRISDQIASFKLQTEKDAQNHLLKELAEMAGAPLDEEVEYLAFRFIFSELSYLCNKEQFNLFIGYVGDAKLIKLSNTLRADYRLRSSSDKSLILNVFMGKVEKIADLLSCPPKMDQSLASLGLCRDNATAFLVPELKLSDDQYDELWCVLLEACRLNMLATWSREHYVDAMEMLVLTVLQSGNKKLFLNWQLEHVQIGAVLLKINKLSDFNNPVYYRIKSLLGEPVIVYPMA